MGPPFFVNIFPQGQREQNHQKTATEGSPLLTKEAPISPQTSSPPSTMTPPIPHSEFSTLRSFTPPLPPTPPHTDPKPLHLFHYAHNTSSLPAPRLIRKTNPRQTLIFTSSFCSNEGKPTARAGYGIHWNEQTHIGHRLEGHGGPETANRAALRAASVAVGIGVGEWKGEGFESVVIATSSPYLVSTICTNAWKYVKRDHEENADLWDVLINLLLQCDNKGILVQFWLIDNEDNRAAEDAKGGALVAKNAREPDWRWLGVVSS